MSHSQKTEAIIVIEDTQYVIDKHYVEGALDFINEVPYYGNPYREGSGKHDQWAYGHENQSAGYHEGWTIDPKTLTMTQDKAKILYVDMDNVLVNFESGIARLTPEQRTEYAGRLDEVPGIFALMDPMEGAIEAFNQLAAKYDTYILSTAPWGNPTAWTDKILWVKEHLGEAAHKRLILSHHKNLNAGDYLIDDRLVNGVDKFAGEHIHFGTADFPDWESVLNHMIGTKPAIKVGI